MVRRVTSLSGLGQPEAMMNAFKSWSTRGLQEEGLVELVERGGRVWSRHGSTRYLWNHGAVEAACAYVRDQGSRSRQGGLAK